MLGIPNRSVQFYECTNLFPLVLFVSRHVDFYSGIISHCLILEAHTVMARVFNSGISWILDYVYP